MLARKKLSNEIDAMKKDATKVIENLSTISSRLTENAKDGATDMTHEAYQTISTELENYRETLDGIKTKVQRSIKNIDKSVKSNPYPFLAGSIGVGYVMGKLLRPASDSRFF